MENKYEEEIQKLLDESNKLKTELLKLKKEKIDLEAKNKSIEYKKNEEERIKEQYLYELLETRKSLSYKLGLALTKIPRVLKKKINENDITRKRVEDTAIVQLEDKKIYPYMLSIVTAVYNTAPFLDEMINSIVEQKTAFAKKYLDNNYLNVWELILVDDGSTDGSAFICDKYAESNPHIRVIHKQNGGVSSARNMGIEEAMGKYITFADSDDKLSNNVIQECITFFEQHYEEISVVSFPNKFFDAQTGDHWTNYRFSEGTRIVDSIIEWDKPLYFTNSTLFKTEDVKGKVNFDSRLIVGEDTKFLYDVLFSGESCIGVVPSCTYWYRRRSIGEVSAIQGSSEDSRCYTEYIKNLLGYLLERSEVVYGVIPKYVQYAVMGQLQWKIRQDGNGEKAISILGKDGYDEYRKEVKKLLKYISGDVIMSQRQICREHKYWLLSNKYEGEPKRLYSEDEKNIKYLFREVSFGDVASSYLQLDFMEIKDDKLYLEGINSSFERATLFLMINGEKFDVEIVSSRNENVYILGEEALYAYAFKAIVPLNDFGFSRLDIMFGVNIKGHDVIKRNIRTRKFMPISRNFTKSYYMCEDWCVRIEDNVLTVRSLHENRALIDYEYEFVRQINKRQDNVQIQKACKIRQEVLQQKAWRNTNKYAHQIWLISDQVDRAGDNGEAFFKFLTIQRPKNVDFYFVIGEDCSDYERMKGIGPVVEFGSKQHIMLHLLADCIISSHADEFVLNPEWRKPLVGDVYRDMLCKKFVFLQHGITMNDLSGWLNRYNKNISGFVCGAISEARSILDYSYHYAEEQIWLTGFARYDCLYHNEKKYITVMPTWRKYLAVDYNSQTSEKGSKRVNERFIDSDYYKFFDLLLNDDKLLENAEQYGYTICFMPHPAIQSGIDLFHHNDKVRFFNSSISYSDVYAESNMVITDYSSSSMDFAWLKKPVVYVQFDKEKFFSGEHTVKPGYFDYEMDGFGEVVYEKDELVDLIIQYMKDGCILKHRYAKRIENFFAHFEQNNCGRIYKKVCELMGLCGETYQVKKYSLISEGQFEDK